LVFSGFLSIPEETVSVYVIGKRNGDVVCRKAKRVGENPPRCHGIDLFPAGCAERPPAGLFFYWPNFDPLKPAVQHRYQPIPGIKGYNLLTGRLGETRQWPVFVQGGRTSHGGSKKNSGKSGGKAC
jgi:hypothetical protein